MKYTSTVAGSYPRPTVQEDTLRKPTVSEEEALEMVRWATEDQVSLGLDIVTDGEAYRENMYWFYQLRLDGIDAVQKKYKQFSLGGSTENVDLSRAHTLVIEEGGFGIECARVVGEIGNPRLYLAQKWKVARETAPAQVKVKQTITGPHMLAKFTYNEREDLYEDDIALANAYADVLIQEIEELQAAGCDYVQFDEPVLTESPDDTVWAADVLNRIIDRFGDIRFGLHICGGNAHRKRAYFGKYTDMVDGLSKLKIHEVHLEHCTLHYNLMDLWKEWRFEGDLSLGVLDQRSDELESVETIWERTRPALEFFSPDRLLLTSECGFGHVPLEITRSKLRRLAEACREFRRKE